MKQKRLATTSVGVKNVPTNALRPNPHNPRMLFDRKPLADLKESIDKVGILVPLTVYQSESTGEFIILDGQRRWMCAQELGFEEVPVNQVAEPTLVQNIVTMFQIHKLREDWELMPTALKLEVLMQQLEDKRDRILAEFTSLDQAVVSRCKKLLSYPRKYQDMMLDPDPAKRVKADFFIELYAVRNDRFVNKMSWFSKDRFTQQMLRKYLSKKRGIKAVTDFRVMKQHISNAIRADKTRVITNRLKEFTEDDSLTLDHLRIQSASVSAHARKILKSVERIKKEVRAIEPEDYYGEEGLWDALQELANLILSKLRQAGRRTKQ